MTNKHRTSTDKKAKRAERAEKIKKNTSTEPSLEDVEIKNFSRAQLAAMIFLAIGYSKILDCGSAMKEGSENPETCYSYMGEENIDTCTHPSFLSMVQVKYHSGISLGALAISFVLLLWHSEAMFLKFTSLLSLVPLGLTALVALASHETLTSSRVWHYITVSAVLFATAVPQSMEQLPFLTSTPFKMNNLQVLSLGMLLSFSLWEILHVISNPEASPENSILQTATPLPAAAQTLTNFWIVDKLSMAAMYAFAVIHLPNDSQRGLLSMVAVLKACEYFLQQRNMMEPFQDSEIIEGATIGSAVLSLIACVGP